MTSYRYSNMTGLWQTIMSSNCACSVVDGNFGSVTKTNTINWQNSIGRTPTGIVDPPLWYATYYAVDGVYAYYRLNWTGVIDGYGTRYVTYYGGSGGCNAALGWNPIASQWLFAPQPSQYWALIQASIARTSYSAGACT
jgi:peptidoglycan hydrolase-like protein with peptidoglycan-binding domain